jgi:hypothetical protein
MANKEEAKIVVSGKGKLSAEVVAVGRGARAEKIVRSTAEALDAKGLQDVHEKLDAVMAAVNAHVERLQDPDSVRQLTQRVGSEIGRQKPDRLTLKGLLAALAEEAKPVAEIITAVLSLKDLILPMF